MASIPSDAFSTIKKMHECPMVNHPVLDLDPGRYKRQIEHFEYYWGLEKGGIDLESPLNRILLRADMSERLKKREWTIMPTQETLQAILSMAEHNKTATLHERRHCLLELNSQEYEYDFVPLHLLKRGGHPSLYVNRGRSTRAVRAPYKSMPRIRSQAHPLFVLWMASEILDTTATFVMPEDQAKAMMFPLSRIILCWLNEPPEEWYMGANVWKPHRHPLSDDGCEVRPTLCTSRETNAAQGGKVRRSTRAPCRQPKTKARAASKPYARLDARHPTQRTSALPHPGVESADDVEGGMGRDRADILAWIDDAASSTSGGVACRRRTRASSSWPSTWLEAEEKEDAELARYRRERARDADDALNPTTNVLLGSGLIIGNGVDWSGYSSNNWAARIYDVCLLGQDPYAAAPE
ncbi:uncharacterized protein SCHCODRAFT_02752466 [Schizophyllum commune H4-8]|uniref:HNH nuclease domain-containing protein n=1 Tax=Schizophyllum commune (strain H4-8 / FGSC 9210) TaxID=578458 RepID=D8QGU5_SCHCM|nr:uncharacterized protein SCHCODRAFT_02752466 [Schizophyllum commune H4-8]KAI5886888.1 hypothetical protein SCHCODRAFT_02752466 [Schizophyllum commune H4-8]